MTTQIDHKIRLALKLTMPEYAVMDFLYSFKGIARYIDYEKNLGMGKGEVQQTLMALKSKAMIEPQPNGEILLCTQWNELFDVPDYIDEIWKIHPTGSKTVCRERLKRVVKKISIADLKQKLIAYIAACKATNTYAKNLETWLNPKAEHWLAPLPVAKDKSPKFHVQEKVEQVTYKVK